MDRYDRRLLTKEGYPGTQIVCPRGYSHFCCVGDLALVLRDLLTQVPLAALERLQVSLAFEFEVARGILEELNQLGNVKFITTVFLYWTLTGYFCQLSFATSSLIQ